MPRVLLNVEYVVIASRDGTVYSGQIPAADEKLIEKEYNYFCNRWPAAAFEIIAILEKPKS